MSQNTKIDTIETPAEGVNLDLEDVNLSDDNGGSEETKKVTSPADMPNAGKDKVVVDPDDSEDKAGGESDVDDAANDSDTFPRAYVEKLRKENASYREKAKTVDALEVRLHTALAAQDGRLASPDDLPFDPAHLEDPEALESAITELIKTRPGLRAQRISGDIGQGKRGTATPTRPGLIEAIRGY